MTRDTTDNAGLSPPPSFVSAAGPAAVRAYASFIEAHPQGRAPSERLGQWMGELGKPLSSITARDIANFLDSVPLAASTRKNYLTQLRLLFDDFRGEGLFRFNPTDTVRVSLDTADEPHHETPPLSRDQFRALLDAAGHHTAIACRDTALFHILWTLGPRLFEISRLDTSDFVQRSETDHLRVTNSRGHSRLLSLTTECTQAITDYFGATNLDPHAREPLFRPAIGKSRRLADKRASAAYLGSVVSRRFREVGMPPAYTADSFRAAVYLRLVQQGYDDPKIQDHFGLTKASSPWMLALKKRMVTGSSRTA